MATVLNTDIYNLSGMLLDLEKQYIDETDQTLAMGIYGYLNAIEAKKLQRTVILTSELANETFPSRAKLERNVITHAIMYNIEDINASPSKMRVLLGISNTDIEAYIKNDMFVIDRECPIYIGDFEFHLEYDIILTKSVLSGNTDIYTARYDISRSNPSSDITNPYLSAPVTLIINGASYIFVSCIISQVSHTSSYTKLVTSNVIDNKTFNFEFTDQLSYFEVHIIEGDEEVYLTPIFEGAGVPDGTNYYCRYTYIDENNIRVKFDRNSYMPGLNAEVEVLIKTTKGKSGDFEYTDDVFINLQSDKYGYKNISVLLKPQSNSENGTNRKSKEELQRLLPKEMLARGAISTTTDLNNYFNMINTDENRIVVQKKIDNQIERTYYAYLVLKDSRNDIIPTNTIDIVIYLDQFTSVDNNRYVLRAGSCIELVGNTGNVIQPEDAKEGSFLYTNPYTIVINRNHLYSAFYMMVMDSDPYLLFTYINQDAKVQFISETLHWERKFLTDNNKYHINITTTQNINKDMGMIVIGFDDEGNPILKENNMKVIAVFYKNKSPYRYKEAKLVSYDNELLSFDWDIELETNDALDENNDIRIENLGIAGYKEHDYGYMGSTTDVRIYVLAKFDTEYGRYDLDSIVPGLDGYTVCNEYTVTDGLSFYYNYSEIMGSRVRPIGETTIEGDVVNIETAKYVVASVPVFGYEYSRDEEFVADAINQLNYRKAYIDNAITILESLGIDFKLFNTYGPSHTYTIDGINYLDRVNIDLTFRLKLVTASDTYTKDYIIRDVKKYIEDLNDIESLHIPNLITQITNTYKNSITYFEFVSINNYGPGVQHLIKDSDIAIHTVPEFISVNTKKDIEGNIIPAITVNIIDL